MPRYGPLTGVRGNTRPPVTYRPGYKLKAYRARHTLGGRRVSPAPEDANYVLQAANALLPNARILAVGGGLLALVDGGAAGPLTVSLSNAGIAHGPLSGLAANDHPQYILGSLLTTNGDLLTRLAGSPARLGIGAAGTYLGVTAGALTYSTPPRGTYLLNHVDTTVDVVNTASETDIYNFTIPGGTVATGDLLELWLPSDLLVNSGANRTYQVRVYLGGTLYYDSTSGGFQVSVRLVTHLQFRFSIRNAASDELMAGQQQQGSFNTAPAVGEGVIGSNPAQVGLAGFPAKDMATNQALRVTVTWSGTGANVSWRCFSAHLIHHRPQ